MSGMDWHYFVPYGEDVHAALQKLRRQEFEAGRYHPSGSKPVTIEEAFEMADATGTRSILDMEQIGASRVSGTAAPLAPSELLHFFGTQRPTHATVQSNWGFFEVIKRGQGVYFIIYKDDIPSEICFAGYSYD